MRREVGRGAQLQPGAGGGRGAGPRRQRQCRVARLGVGRQARAHGYVGQRARSRRGQPALAGLHVHLRLHTFRRAARGRGLRRGYSRIVRRARAARRARRWRGMAASCSREGHRAGPRRAPCGCRSCVRSAGSPGSAVGYETAQCAPRRPRSLYNSTGVGRTEGGASTTLREAVADWLSPITIILRWSSEILRPNLYFRPIFSYAPTNEKSIQRAVHIVRERHMRSQSSSIPY